MTNISNRFAVVDAAFKAVLEFADAVSKLPIDEAVNDNLPRVCGGVWVGEKGANIPPADSMPGSDYKQLGYIASVNDGIDAISFRLVGDNADEELFEKIAKDIKQERVYIIDVMLISPAIKRIVIPRGVIRSIKDCKDDAMFGCEFVIDMLFVDRDKQVYSKREHELLAEEHPKVNRYEYYITL